MGVGRIADIGHFDHQRFINVGAASSIEHDHIKTTQLCRLHGTVGDLNRRLSRAAHIKRRHQNFFLLFLGQAQGKLASGSCFTGTLKTHHHDADRRGCIEADGFGFFAQHGHQLVVNNFHDHLARRYGFDDFGTNGLFAHGFILVGKRTTAGESVKYAA